VVGRGARVGIVVVAGELPVVVPAISKCDRCQSSAIKLNVIVHIHSSYEGRE
jgi:hypothetical protein